MKVGWLNMKSEVDEIHRMKKHVWTPLRYNLFVRLCKFIKNQWILMQFSLL